MNAYDFDDTIYRGDSSLHFFVFYLRKEPGLVRYLPTVVKILSDYHKEKIQFGDITARFGDVFKEYFSTHNVDFDQVAKEFWDKHEKRIKPFYKEIQKEDDLIITASPSFMAEEICRRLGIKHCLSTDFDTKTGEFRRACFREKKIDFLLEAFPDGQIEDFYTDSMNDKFLFPYAKRVFMVKGNKITRIK